MKQYLLLSLLFFVVHVKALESVEAVTGVSEISTIGTTGVTGATGISEEADFTYLEQFPLHRAVRKNDKFEVRRLIASGIDVNGQDGLLGATSLYYAAGNGSDDDSIAEMLIDAGADVSIPIFNGFQPLHNAAMTGNHIISALLVKAGANVNAKINDNGFTPLHCASLANTKTVDLLIKFGADVNAIDLQSRIPLHLAIWSEDIVTLLMQSHANVNAKNGRGETPLDEARHRKWREIEELLLKAGAVSGKELSDSGIFINAFNQFSNILNWVDRKKLEFRDAHPYISSISDVGLILMAMIGFFLYQYYRGPYPGLDMLQVPAQNIPALPVLYIDPANPGNLYSFHCEPAR